MTFITVFLLVLVVALGIGNALLSFFASGRKTPDLVSQVTAGSEPNAFEQAVFIPSSGIAPIEKKLELAHARIQGIEAKLSQANKGHQGYGIDLSLRKKIERLDNFRSTAESEIIAIKDILTELQNNNVTIKARSFKNTHKGKNVSRDELHKIIYRSSL